MRRLRSIVRCSILKMHRWELIAADDSLDSGRQCRDCDEVALERYVVEREHDVGPKGRYGGYGSGAGIASPGP